MFAPFSFAQANSPITTLSTSQTASAPDGSWIQDATVTFLGQAVARSNDFLNFMLTNYQWGYTTSSLSTAWVGVRNIVFVLLVLIVLIAAFVIIVTGGTNITALLFTRRFIYFIFLISFSFAIIQLLYQIADIFQGFFLHNPNGTLITTKNLLNLSFNYQSFIGYKKAGSEYIESAFIANLLVQLTAITNYVMASVLLTRKIFLWFFLIISPLYPLVLLYFPVKITAKVWISEFFRWLLYAPLFSIFLSALVIIWRSNINILPFQVQNPLSIYPTAISILLGGPGQTVSLTNSINAPNTFLQYVAALLMLWAVIILPFVLLQLLFDSFSTIPLLKDPFSRYVQEIGNAARGIFPLSGKPLPPSSNTPAGAAKVIPTASQNDIQETIKNIHSVQEPVTRMTSSDFSSRTTQQVTNTTNVNQTSQSQEDRRSQTTQSSRLSQNVTTYQAHLKPEASQKETLKLVSFPIPTMRDIVTFEISRFSKVTVTPHALTQIKESLQKIANPQATASLTEKQYYAKLKDTLSIQATKGDPLAKSVLTAASVALPSQTKQVVQLPAVNQVQTVSIDDYETVKALWVENYKNIDIPKTIEGLTQTRTEWIGRDVQAVDTVIRLLTSSDPQNIQKGFAEVSSTLPFILLGGFSQTEVIAYLKAKQEAGKMVQELLSQKEQEKETLVTNTAKVHEEKELQAEES